MLKIERKPIDVDEGTWFYVGRKSLHMVHWFDTRSGRRCSTFRVPVKLLRRTLVILAMQAGKERARRKRAEAARTKKARRA